MTSKTECIAECCIYSPFLGFIEGKIQFLINFIIRIHRN